MLTEHLQLFHSLDGIGLMKKEEKWDIYRFHLINLMILRSVAERNDSFHLSTVDENKYKKGAITECKIDDKEKSEDEDEEEKIHLLFFLSLYICVLFFERTFRVLLIYSSSRHILTFETNANNNNIDEYIHRFVADLSNLSKRRKREKERKKEAFSWMMPFSIWCRLNFQYSIAIRIDHEVELIEIVWYFR